MKLWFDMSFTAVMAALSIPAAVVHSAESSSQYQPRHYMIDVPPAFIQQTRTKAANYRPTLDISAPPWFDGPPTANITAVSHYIESTYNWFEYQDFINTNFSHYMTTVPSPGSFYPHDLDIHFIHETSDRDDAIPILLLHGWPSTSLEWEKVVLKLANPEDSSKPAFHVVAPDLPGFGFSPAPIAPGLGGPGYASICASLMQQLGYHSYNVYSTDLGFAVALEMVEQFEERILHHVTDFYVVLPNATDTQRYTENQTSPEETSYMNSINAFLEKHSAYASIHDTFPLTIAHALNDSPMGFLAWMWHLDFSVRDLSVPYTTEELVSQAMTLFIPGIYGNIRAYKELFPILLRGATPSSTPTSVTQWGYPRPGYPELVDFNYVPREWVERTANITFFNRHDSGGHYPAYTQPVLWLQDIHQIFSK